MNKGIYRLVWNNSQGALQVVSETAKSKTCSGSGARASTGLRKATVWPLALLSLSMATCAVAAPGYGVTTDANSGTGSLREGLALGGYLMVDPSITRIALSSDATVLNSTTLNVTGPLTVTGASLAGSGSALVLNGTSAGTLTIAIAGQFKGRNSDVGSATNGVAGTAGVGPGGAGGAGGNGTLLAPVAGASSGVSGSFFDLTNNRLVSGGYGMSVLSAGNGGAGGVGARGNLGSPGGTGGSGGAGANGGNGAAGGAGVSGNNFTLTNNDTIYGGIGASGTNGGAGGAGGTGGDYGGGFSDEGGAGGRGGNGGNGGNGGAGGAGVSGYAMQVFNTGMIVGGDGGRAGNAGAGGLGGNAGDSDFGLNLPGANGSGGSAGSAGAGGVGIVSTGNSTIRNAGAIAGGLANQSTGTQANAIEFSGGGNTLILEAGSEILGNVVSTSGGTDTLAFGGNVNALSNGFNLSDLGTQYQGFDSFQKLGTSTWTLTGTDTVSRIWDVQAGTLVLENNTQLAGALGIRNDGTLSSGTASIGGGLINAGHLNIADGATLSLGSSYTQGSHGTLSIGALSTAQYGKLAITGNAFLAGALDVDVKSGNTLVISQQLLDVVTATGHISGTFDTVSDNSLLFNFTPTYTNNSVSLNIVADSGGNGGGVGNAGNGNTVQGSVQALGNTPGRGAARVLDGVIAGNPSGRLAGYFVPLSTQGEVSQAVSETLPLMAGGSTESARTALSGINGVIQGRSEAVRGLSSGDATFTDQHGWIKPFGSWADQESRGGVAGVNTSVGGLAFGLDASLNDRWLLGTAFIYANVNTRNSGDTARQQLKTDVYQLVGYGSYHLDDRTDLNFQLDAGQNHNKGTRDIDFAGLQAKSNYDSWTAHAGVSLDRTFTLTEQTRFIPSVRADYTWIKDEAYREKGAEDLNLSAKSRSTDQFILGVDGKLSHDLTQQLNVSANLGVGYDFLAERDSISSSFAGAPGASFTTYSGDPQRWLVRGGTGLNYQVNGQLQLGVRYDLEKRTDYLNQTGSVEARWAF
ncbi:autotransporter domain-containing protein [Pseudomonas kairouanensis]|uniref:Autotransporter domain-containing protein n=1 Tax=Pseudomonas kairouanensis TaxID=2293832 RepID=A0A4Z0ASG9_9PSED|nr:autotransporter domain-containing protein [Pseudomonas kairouanensis]TFY89119.1 autotransporter domain-containing protein [Pseudomonas kairouanensis]